MLSANRDSLIPSFSICMPFTYFSGLTMLARTSSTVLNRVVRVDILAVFLILGGTHFFTIKYVVGLL